jgi:5'(3')-deoxyribonucleotidase
LGQLRAAPIGFDLDGVIADIVGQLLLFLQLKSGIDLSRDDLVSENIETCTPISREILTTFFCDPGFFTTMRPLSGARRLLTMLIGCGHPVHIVTDRFWYPGLHEHTNAWLREHEIPFDSLRFARKTEKQEVVSELDLQWFIEDQLSNANRIASSCRVLLLDRPYNKGIVCPNVERVSGLRNIAEMILGSSPTLINSGCRRSSS